MLEYADIKTENDDLGDKGISISHGYISVSELLNVDEIITTDSISDSLIRYSNGFKLFTADSLGPPGCKGVMCNVMEAHHAC